jgi:hypothetical protein
VQAHEPVQDVGQGYDVLTVVQQNIFQQGKIPGLKKPEISFRREASLSSVPPGNENCLNSFRIPSLSRLMFG